MAPEQVLGQDCDHRADIFSLGIVLYELFSGHSPFKGVHAAALTYEIVNVDTPPISSIKSDINPELDALVSECLAKDPNERIQSAAEVRRKLGVITGETRSHTKSSAHHTAPQSEHSAQASRGFFLAGKKWLLAAIGLLALSFAVLAVIHFAEPENLDLSKYQFTPIASDAEPQTEPAWSPDGKGITYTKKVDGIFQVFIRNLDSPLPSKLTNLVSNAETPFWSHDGNLVYFISNRNLCSIGLAGGEHRKLLRSVYAATISPDGKAIAYWSFQNGTSSVYIALVNDTTGRKYEPAPFEIGGSWYPNYIQFSPDGKRIGLSTYRSGGRGAQFWILPWPDGEGAKPFKAFEGALFQDPVSFAWMPDSRHILLSNRKKLWIGEAETGKMRQVFPLIDEGIRHISVSPDGTRIVATVQRENYNIIQLPLDGSQPRNVMASSRDEKSMSWSRAGDKAIYITDRSGEDEIWLAINGTDIRPIITKKDFPNAEHPRIVAATMSPDGSRIAFSFSQKEFGGRTFITSTDGGKPTRVFSGETDEQNCAWSSDGKYLAAYVTEKGALKLGVALVGSQEPPRFIADVDSLRGWLNWSPDNKWIASGLRHDIVLISPDGKSRKIIASPEIGASDEYLLVWSKDGATIYVACSRGRGARLHAVDVKTGRSRKIAEYGDEIVFSAQWFYELFGCLAPDGKSIVTTVVDYKSDIWMLEGLPQK
ncbi:MAG: protein kinase, partial [Ignavibacteriales bacterium]|nr:protein kinase [Ignavibacteriales bacterium]